MNTFVKRIKDQRGVTLIELLAVIVILGIIAAVAVPAVMNNFDSARTSANTQSLNIVKEAAQRYLLMENPDLSKVTVTIDNLVPKYLDSIPTNSDNQPAQISIDASTRVVTASWKTN